MTQDQILAALREVVAKNSHFTTWTVSTPHLVALVNLAIEREREACAKVCEAGINNATDWDSSYWDQCCENRAAAIRARSQT
jgi:hypothetical protein